MNHWTDQLLDPALMADLPPVGGLGIEELPGYVQLIDDDELAERLTLIAVLTIAVMLAMVIVAAVVWPHR